MVNDHSGVRRAVQLRYNHVLPNVGASAAVDLLKKAVLDKKSINKAINNVFFILIYLNYYKF
jgi:hypothetical protein